MCEENLRTLDKLKEDFEPLKLRYQEARDYHKAIKGRLRRDYYHFLKLASLPPDPSMGIEAKAAALASLQVPDDLAAERKRITGILKELAAAHTTEKSACDDYCVAHNELREFVYKTKKSAKECYMLAMRALKKRR